MATIGIEHLPNQRHKIEARKGASFTLMVVGESGLGKTTFINTLFATTMKEYRQPPQRTDKMQRTVTIDMVRADVEEKGFNVRLNVIDTPGFGDYMNNQDCWVPIIEFIDDQHHSYMKQESGPDRKNIDDLRVNACLYFIQPSGHTLTPLDIKVMKMLGTRVNLIPVVAKADTLTPTALKQFKARIRDCITANGIKVYMPQVEDDDETDTAAILEAMPFSVIASETEILVNGQKVRGREYLWGVAEVENEDHCDFKKLRNLLIRTHLHDLIQSTKEDHYEAYRAKVLTGQGVSDDDPLPQKVNNKMKTDEEDLRKRFTEQVRLEEARFRQWEQKLIGERDRLNKDLEEKHRVVKELENEVEELTAANR
ncbi:Septin-domain-containing protein [Gorgonomyces haynaldii]|nr:Septin-domain-containing protein [Gorgonomyces haynaldii]